MLWYNTPGRTGLYTIIGFLERYSEMIEAQRQESGSNKGSEIYKSEVDPSYYDKLKERK